MDNTIDLLQIKIDKAKASLPEETLDAIAAVPWQAEILKMRETKGYSFEQLGDLELETELLLCGLVSSRDYPKELEKRMKISKAQANELVLEMNKEVFSKIKEALIKNSEQKKSLERKELLQPAIQSNFIKPISPVSHDEEEERKNTQVLKAAGIEITNGNEKKETLPEPEKLELTTPPARLPMSGAGGEKSAPAMLHVMPKKEISPVFAQKLAGSFQIPSVKTEHTLDNITRTGASAERNVKADKPHMDPYREIPE